MENYPDTSSNTMNPIFLMNLASRFVMRPHGFAFFIGLFGNIFVIYVILRFSKMQTVTNIYFLNIAMVDVLYLINLLFYVATLVIGFWPFGEVMCKIHLSIHIGNVFIKGLLLIAICTDRYIAVCHPISSSKYRTLVIAKFICLTAWLVFALLSIPMLLYGTTNKDEIIFCYIHWPDNAFINGDKAFILYAFILGFVIPLVFALILCFMVLCKLRQASLKNSRHKVTYLVFIILTVYFMCCLPYWISQIMLIFPSDHKHFIFGILADCLLSIGSAINPILYAALSENFRISFLKTLNCVAKDDINALLSIEDDLFSQSEHTHMDDPNRSCDNEQSTALPVMMEEGTSRYGTQKSARYTETTEI